MGKGRDKLLISQRNEKLIRRWYYWTEIRRRRFDDALAILSQEEFFISEQRIMTIIRQNCNKIADIATKPVTLHKISKVNARQLSLFTGE